MSLYSIKDLEHLSGIKAHTLRIWEQRYNLVNPKRTDTNIRYYDDKDLKLVLNVSLLKDHGFKISKIAKMSDDDLKEKVMSITQLTTGSVEQIQALTLAMINLDEEHFEKIISTNVLQIGFERTMIQTLYPFLSKIGFLWQTGTISPCQEHFVSNLIRQKIIVAIDGQVMAQPKQGKYMLFLPEGELHELSLLFSSYMIQTRHHKVVYLGQSLPLNDFIEAYKIHQPEYILSIMTTAPSQEEIQDYIRELAEVVSASTLLLSGYQVIAQDLEMPKNTVLINKVEDLISFVESH
jgi:MerR family transcriptional regulator, light-induced transcriptional regulator